MHELVARGLYTPQQAQRAAAKNYVTRALGVEPTVEVDVTEIAVLPDDLFLLCSDGLSDMVEDDDIQLTMNTFGANLSTLARQLVLLGNDNGGRDNISVVLVRVLDGFPARRGVIERVRAMFS
jgi:protein phosphatase